MVVEEEASGSGVKITALLAVVAGTGAAAAAAGVTAAVEVTGTVATVAMTAGASNFRLRLAQDSTHY